MKVGPLDDDRPRLLRDDAAAMDRSASVLRLRARKPDAIITRAVGKVLRENAARLRAEADAIERAS